MENNKQSITIEKFIDGYYNPSTCIYVKVGNSDRQVELTQDTDTNSQLRQKLHSCFVKDLNTYYCIDLTDVIYIDTSGLATLLEFLQKTNSIGSRLGLISHDGLKDMFVSTRLDGVFLFCNDMGEMLNSIEREEKEKSREEDPDSEWAEDREFLKYFSRGLRPR